MIAGAKYGLFDTVQDGETGYLVNDDSELADRIVHLLTDRAAAQRMGEKARLFARSSYAFENITPRWQALLSALAEGRPVPAAESAGPARTLGTAFARRNGRLKGLFGMPKWWPSYLGVRDRAGGVLRSLQNTTPRLFGAVQFLRGK